MIVKDEAPVIRRCLDSVRRFIDGWVVVDTGSTDGTQAIVREALAGLPGALHERPWKDFAHNRTEAIELARGKADYLLIIDADDVLEAPAGFVLPELTLDGYDLRVEDHELSYDRPHIVRADRDFYFEGVLHEALRSRTPRTSGRIDGLVYRRLRGGARSMDPQRYRRDAEVLERALAAEPGNTRHAFYLGGSWKDAGELEKAAAAYERRATMAGFDEEIFLSLFYRARLLERLGRPDDEVVAAYLRAFDARPRRVEPLVELARLHRTRARWALAHLFAAAAIAIPRPADVLFVEKEAYTWRSLDEYAVSSYYVDRIPEALAANERLLAGGEVPASERARIEANRAFCLAKLGPPAPSPG
jgi:glycosyltransferase involved in cell wall biosynthesis